MKIDQTIYVLNEKTGSIEERVIVEKVKSNGKEMIWTISKGEFLVGEGKNRFDYKHWCFETLEEAKKFQEKYKKEMKNKIKESNIMQDMFNAWAREYADEKDYIQKIAMVEFLKEEYGIEIDIKDFYKTIRWENDAKNFRTLEEAK